MTSNQKLSLWGNWNPTPKGYFYFLPADIYEHDRRLQIPNFIVSQLEQCSRNLGKLEYQVQVLQKSAAHEALLTVQEAVALNGYDCSISNLITAYSESSDVGEENKLKWEAIQTSTQACQFTYRLSNEMPLSNRLIGSLHRQYYDPKLDKDKLPGIYRRSQTWLGGNQISAAYYVPPSQEHLKPLMSNFEQYLTDGSKTLPKLIKLALVYFQFVNISPFIEANEKVAKTLITLYLLDNDLLCSPIFCISEFFQDNQQRYYSCLDQARVNEQGMIEWITFFLEAVDHGAKRTSQILDALSRLEDTLLCSTFPKHFGRRTTKAMALLELLLKKPIVNAKFIQQSLKFSPQITHNLLHSFREIGILQEMTGYNRNRVFKCTSVLEILSVS